MEITTYNLQACDHDDCNARMVKERDGDHVRAQDIAPLLALQSACREAGLMDEQGKLIRPRWVVRNEATIVNRDGDDDDWIYPGDRVYIARAPAGMEGT